MIGQILDHLATAGRACQASYLRTSDRYEIDLLLDLPGRRWALEIKLTSVSDLADMQRLVQVGKLVKADRCLLLSRTEEFVEGRTTASLNLPAAIERLLAD